MPQPPIPLATMLHWARDKGLRDVLVLGRDPGGTVQVANSGGTGEEILAVLTEAKAMIERRLGLTPSDLAGGSAVRLSTDKPALSDAVTG